VISTLSFSGSRSFGRLITGFSLTRKMKRVHWKCFFLFLSVISVMISSVFAVRSLLAVAICSNFSSARRIGKQLPPVPTSAMPGRQPGCRGAALPPPLPRPPHPRIRMHTGSICHLLSKALLPVARGTSWPVLGLLGSSHGVQLQEGGPRFASTSWQAWEGYTSVALAGETLLGWSSV